MGLALPLSHSLSSFPCVQLCVLMHSRSYASASCKVSVKELTGTVKRAKERTRERVERGGERGHVCVLALSFIELLLMRPQRTDRIVAFN